MALYFDSCYTQFDHVLTATSAISQNGDDAIELFLNDSVVETFGDINVDGTGECWEYMDSWAYKSAGDSTCLGGNWIFGGVNCTDGTTTTYNSSCPYPLCPLPSGCTDSLASNYDPSALVDDGSCLYSVTFNVDMNCEDSTSFGFVHLESPVFGWCGGCVPCLLYTSPSPRDRSLSRMPSSA